MIRQILFIALSFGDLVMTWWLLTTYPDIVYESNPFADWLLQTYGWPSLLVLKLAVIGVLLYSCHRLYSRRPHVARGVLNLGCLVLAGVIAYSGFLGIEAQASVDEMARLYDEQIALKEKSALVRRHLELVNQLSDDLIAERITLTQAVREMENSERSKCDKEWIKRLEELYSTTDRNTLFAAALLQHVSVNVVIDDMPIETQEETLSRLTKEFIATYGTDVTVPLPAVVKPI